MTRQSTLLFALLALLLWGIMSVIAVRAQVIGPSFEAQALVAGATEVKFPHIAATEGQVHLSSNTSRTDASYWSKDATATGFGAARVLGQCPLHVFAHQR